MPVIISQRDSSRVIGESVFLNIVRASLELYLLSFLLDAVVA